LGKPLTERLKKNKFHAGAKLAKKKLFSWRAWRLGVRLAVALLNSSPLLTHAPASTVEECNKPDKFVRLREKYLFYFQQNTQQKPDKFVRPGRP
jgi:hypothetical protein